MLRSFVGVGLALILAATAVGAAGDTRTTIGRTIGDADGDNLLEYLAGDGYLVRTELAPASGDRGKRRASTLFFAQLTDTHVLDEESPLRAEFVDRVGPPLTSAYRPNEGLSPQVLESMVRRVRGLKSPVSGKPLALVMTTGDNSDNTQRNEVRWLIDELDGGRTVNPDSGRAGTCGLADDGSRYDGVRGGGEYYEPDASGPGPDGPGYAPDEAENLARAGRASQVRDHPGLFEAMNEPYRATGLGIPWYGIFGNHDGLIQGNQGRNEAFEALAVGCIKVTALTPGGMSAVEEIMAGGVSQAEIGRLWTAVYEDMLTAAADPEGAGANVTEVVPADPERRPLTKAEYIAEHFDTVGTPVGHGFAAQNILAGMGNYAFSPRPGVRFIVLDSINETGGADGNLDDVQFRWLHQELRNADLGRQLAVVFAHHSLRTMVQTPASGFVPGDQGGDASLLVHFGGADEAQPCVLADPAAPPTPDETVRCLLLRHPSAIAMVVGHEHENRVVAYERRDAASAVVGGFWELTTASHIDWPQQSRVIEIVDNRDGTLSLFGTILDHSAPPVPEGKRLDAVGRLASIARELSFNDPDARNGEDGTADARGAPEDRNVELLLRHPFAP